MTETAFVSDPPTHKRSRFICKRGPACGESTSHTVGWRNCTAQGPGLVDLDDFDELLATLNAAEATLERDAERLASIASVLPDVHRDGDNKARVAVGVANLLGTVAARDREVADLRRRLTAMTAFAQKMEDERDAALQVAGPVAGPASAGISTAPADFRFLIPEGSNYWRRLVALGFEPGTENATNWILTKMEQLRNAEEQRCALRVVDADHSAAHAALDAQTDIPAGALAERVTALIEAWLEPR